MSSLVTAEMRAQATEFYTGDEICQEKTKFLLTEMCLPSGLLPLENIEECGYIEPTGFVWLKQKKKKDHKFEKISKSCQYAQEITAYVEKHKIKKLTGVKAKELMMWVTVCDIYIDDPASGKITFKTPTTLFRTFPTSAFENDVAEKKQVDVKKDADVNGVNAPSGVAVAKEVEVKKDDNANAVKAPSDAAVVAKEVEVKEV